MSYASKFGRAKINTKNPQAFAICDRCGFGFNHVDLRFQMDYAGAALVNKRVLVCHHCYDEPNEQLRAIILPPDPVPIMNPRVPDFHRAEANTRQTSGFNTVDHRTGIPVPGGSTRTTQADDNRVTQQTGAPPGSRNQQAGWDANAPGASKPGLPYDNDPPTPPMKVPDTGPLK